MELNTASSVISQISKMEQESAEFYEKWAKECEELKDIFLSFSKENKKNEKNIKRAYYSVVSDALETNFCFKGLRADFSLPSFPGEPSVSDLLNASIKLEIRIEDFYQDAATCSKALLADVPRAMERVAKLRKARVERLRDTAQKIIKM